MPDEDDQYSMMHQLRFAHKHLTRDINLGTVRDSLTFLGGGGGAKTEKGYPQEDISLFYMLLSAHFVSAVFLFGEKMIEGYHNFPVLHGFFTNLLCTCFYTLIVIYCIFKNRVIKHDDEKNGDNTACESLVEAWLNFEVRVMMMWLIACAIFLFYG